MAFNGLWGVGRDPKVAGKLVQYDISSADVGTGWPNNTTTIDTFSIPDGNVRIFAMQIALRPRSSNSTTGTATTPQITVKIDGATIAQYTLPQSGSDSAEWNIQEMVPYSYDVSTPNGSIFSIERSTTALGGDGYACNFVISLFGVLI